MQSFSGEQLRFSGILIVFRTSNENFRFHSQSFLSIASGLLMWNMNFALISIWILKNTEIHKRLSIFCTLIKPESLKHVVFGWMVWVMQYFRPVIGLTKQKCIRKALEKQFVFENYRTGKHIFSKWASAENRSSPSFNPSEFIKDKKLCIVWNIHNCTKCLSSPGINWSKFNIEI